MNSEKLYSLIPIEDFKAVLIADDRDDKLIRYCLVTATHTIEQHCMRLLMRKRHIECIDFYGDLILPLGEYPVSKVLAVYVVVDSREWKVGSGESGKRNEEFLEEDFYSVVPGCGSNEEWPYMLSLSPALRYFPDVKSIKVVYEAGYRTGNAPPDLASACLELAAWNLGRYKGRRIGMTGNARGRGKEGEHFELSMPENVCHLLEPYKRKVI